MGSCISSTKQVAAISTSEETKHPTFISFNHFLTSMNPPRIGNWIFRKEIGKGILSRVYMVENTENLHEYAAAKVYNAVQLTKQTLRPEDSPIKAVEREIGLMMQIDNSYILSIIEYILDEPTQSLIIVMPFAPNGNVQSLLEKNKITQEMISICFHQVGKALEYLHSNNIVHRDIKPENILSFTDDYYVLSDFSVSKVLESDDQLIEDTKGSPAFLSPEECSGEPCDGKAADVWAYGVSLYSAIFGKLPFNLDIKGTCTVANTILIVTQKLESEKLEFPENTDVDTRVIDLLTQILNKDPSKRPTITEIIQNQYFEKAWEIDKKNTEEDELLRAEYEAQNNTSPSQ